MATKTRKARAPKVLRQTFGPFTGMRTALEERASDPSLVQYALNMFPADPEHGGAYLVRPPFIQTSGMTTGSTPLFHVLVNALGTQPVALAAGELWTLQGDTTWGRVVSTADFATAGIGLDGSAATYYAITFAGQMIVSDGVNPPWMWDGTAGSGGLTLLSNCPPLYGQPTEYAGKLFGIKASDHLTIVWSEENDAATGYEAGGFNNAWTISQQADTPLVGLRGRNDGLYYWRTQGFGVVVGAVAGDFRTTHTHDSLSTIIGLAGPGAVADSGDALWWYGSNERVYCYPIGGALLDVSPENAGPRTSLTPFPWPSTPLRWVRRGDLAGPTPVAIAGVRAAVIGPNDVNDRPQVWFGLPTGVQSPEQMGVLLLYDVGTRRALGWYGYAGNPTTHRYSNLTAFQTASGRHGVFAVWLAQTDTVFAPAFGHFMVSNGAPIEFGGVRPMGTLIGPVAGGTDTVEVCWTRTDVAVTVPVRNMPLALTLQLMGSALDVAEIQATTVEASSVTSTFGAHTARAVFGTEVVGRWVRPVLTLDWQTTVGNWQGAGVQGYTVQGTAASEDPDAA